MSTSHTWPDRKWLTVWLVIASFLASSLCWAENLEGDTPALPGTQFVSDAPNGDAQRQGNQHAGGRLTKRGHCQDCHGFAHLVAHMNQHPIAGVLLTDEPPPGAVARSLAAAFAKPDLHPPRGFASI
jgi:hypothetical protein